MGCCMISSKDKSNVFWGKKLWVTILRYLVPLGKAANDIDWSSLNYTFFQIVAHGWREEELAGCGERKKKVLGATSHELRLGFLWGLSYQLPTTLWFATG